MSHTSKPISKSPGRKNYWTPKKIVAAILEADNLLGRRPSQPDFDPSHARRLGHIERAELAAEMIALGEWPTHHTIAAHFGSFSEAMVAAGYPKRRPGQPKSNEQFYGSA